VRREQVARVAEEHGEVGGGGAPPPLGMVKALLGVSSVNHHEA
jgi:hypothetical protein